MTTTEDILDTIASINSTANSQEQYNQLMKLERQLLNMLYLTNYLKGVASKGKQVSIE